MSTLEYLVRFGRTNGQGTKTLFWPSKKTALFVGNSVANLLWSKHPFKAVDLQEGRPIRMEQEGFWIELKIQQRKELP